MSCDYPCHICDPEEWAEETKPPPYDFEAVYERTVAAFDRKPGTQLSWWVPMDGWPEGVTIRNERKYDDIASLSGRKITMLADDRNYMEKPVGGWGGGVERFPIISYMQKVLDWDKGVGYISAVQSQTPPPWGWWMPTLNP